MILSHRAPSCFNMSSYRAIWTHFKQCSMIFEQINISKFVYLNFQIPENWSLFVGRLFFRKLFASKNDAERYGRNILGPNFQKHILFQLNCPWALASQFGICKIACIPFLRSKLTPVALLAFTKCCGSPWLVGTLPQAFFFSEKGAPRFLEPLTCGYVAAGVFFFQKKGPHILGSL